MQALDLTTKFFKPLMKHLHIHPTIIRYSIHTVLGRCDFPFHDEWKFLPVNIFKGSIAVPEALEAANTVIFPQPAPSQSYFIGTIGTTPPPPPTPPPPLEQVLYIFHHLWENLIRLDSIFARQEIVFLT